MKKLIKIIISSVTVACLLCSCTKNDAGAGNAAAEEPLREVTLILDPNEGGAGISESTEQVQPGDAQTDDGSETTAEAGEGESDSQEETAEETGDDTGTVSEPAAEADSGESDATVIDGLTVSSVTLTDSMPYASFSAINTGAATLYKNPDSVRGKYVI